MPELPEDRADTPASFQTLTGPPLKVDVHFNPASLQYQVSNTLREEGRGARKKQYVSQTSAKLTMELVFDTTDTGTDVRSVTSQMAQMLQPIAEGSSKFVPPTVKFSWGAYSFTGLVEQYKETIDFFAPGGLPLRASINLTLANQDKVFETGASGSRASVDGDLAPEPVVVPDDGGPVGGAQGLANALGAPRAARAIAAANGAASLRFGGGGGLAVGASANAGFSAGASMGAGFAAGIGASAGAGLGAGASVSASVSASGGVSLLPAAAFAAGGGAGLGVSAGLGVGGGAGFGVGAGGGAELSLGGGAGAGLSTGGGVSLGSAGGGGFAVGTSASAGFSGLRSETTMSNHALSTGPLLHAGVSSSTRGAVAAGGRLVGEGGSGLKVDVGAEADFVIGIR
ncbi:MAG: hypothetical protein GX576_12730 [Thauera phenolivorans]|uniref:Contractile injection system tube protein N-terminal domain-containing protein n=1 Tax=Thauera phenolivorans TaxID=1792543 RepID=A0A7X7LXV5_9RHOO|nr:hypothetical protein [Thauera phenolivorans]